MENRLEELAKRFGNIENSLNQLQQQLNGISKKKSEQVTTSLSSSSTTITTSESSSSALASTIIENPNAIIHESNFDREEPNDTELIKIVKKQVQKLCFKFANFSQVPKDYYSRPLEARRDLLQTASMHQLCKSLILENSKCVLSDCSVRTNSKYYCVIVQYSAKFNSKKLTKYVRELNQGKLGKKQFVFSLTDAPKAFELTGYEFNGVSPVALPEKENINIPIVLDKKIVDEHKQFWIGGGSEDWKILFNTDEFIKIYNPFVTSITYEGNETDEE